MARSCSSGWILALAVLLLGACDGSSGGGSSGLPTGPSPSLVFTPDRAAPSGSIAMRSGGGTTAERLELEIAATDALNLHSLDFVLTFPPELLRFDGARQGELLGADASLVVQGVAQGALLFLITRSPPGGVTGSGVALVVDYTALAPGSGRLDFADREAQDPDGLEIAGLEWIGGTVQIVR